MSNAKHIPGPWHVRVEIWATDPSILIAECCTLDGPTEALANARLIAAAPELLAACKTALVVVSEIADIDNESRAGWAHREQDATIQQWVEAVVNDMKEKKKLADGAAKQMTSMMAAIAKAERGTP